MIIFSITFHRLPIVIFLIIISLLNSDFFAQENFTSSNLPIFVINTNGKAIVDENRITAELGIIFNELNNRNYLTEEFNNYNSEITIELRGSSSMEYPKKQYRFETVDSINENLNVSLCGLPKENDWILNGPYNDKTLIHNFLAYGLSNKLGRYASRTVFCELILNNEYQGLYILLETVKRDKNRINISQLTNIENEGDELTGGYIVKIDKMDGENIDFWYSKYGTPFQYHYPKPDEITQSQKDYIQNYLNDFEELMFNNNDNYDDFIEVDSFIDHFIINEFCKNVDAYRLSSYLYKDKDSKNAKLVAGPIWDFNLTFGDAWNEEDMFRADGWQVNYSLVNPYDGFRVPFWWNKLFADELFREKLSKRWYELRENILSYDSLFNMIDSTITYISEARIRNFERWSSVLNPYPYEEEIVILKGWIGRRITWIEENLPRVTKIDNNNIVKNEFELLQNFPNPFNPTTTIEYSVPSVAVISNEVRNLRDFSSQVPRNDNNVSLKIYDILGREISTLVNEKQNPGNYKIQFNGENLPSGIYFYTINSGNFHQTKKMILLK
ncbi:MAG: CotH kinase family protein [Ignavibacteriae bacterium]|nr:CotH kinase family protein [Ignavibacteriota bacterium]